MRAVDAMLEIAKMKNRGMDNDVLSMANWWLSHPHYDAWEEHPELKQRFNPVKIETDYKTPRSFGARSDLPALDKILALEGSAERGASLIGRCAMCHKVNDAMGGVDFGPDISAFGKTQSREIILSAIVNPSQDIAHGYDGRSFTMKNGKQVEGILMGETNDTVTVKVYGGENLTISKDDIAGAGKKLDHSLMVPAADMGLSAQDVRDIVEYMKSAE
jgi:putative heme-binding domain-containing protein